jgi:hypothetical protein
MRVFVRANVAGKSRRVCLSEGSEDFFEPEEGLVDSNGTLLCPVCGCCQLVNAVPKRRAGEPYGLVCRSGCSKTKKHVA